jgi:hypothetical protein
MEAPKYFLVEFGGQKRSTRLTPPELDEAELFPLTCEAGSLLDITSLSVVPFVCAAAPFLRPLPDVSAWAAILALVAATGSKWESSWAVARLAFGGGIP